MRATILDVAKAAGVSTTTVSLVLNKSEKSNISNQTQNLVREFAEKYNYVPRQKKKRETTSSPAVKRSPNLAIIVDGLQDNFIAKLIENIEANARKSGLNLSLGISNYDAETEFERLCEMKHNATAVIIVQPAPNESNLLQEFINENDIPVILLYRSLQPVRGIDVITFDDTQIGWIATEHLIQKGCKHIACINVSSTTSLAQDSRFQGYRLALANKGIEFDPELVVNIEQRHPNTDYASLTHNAVKKMFSKLGYYPDGIFAANRYYFDGIRNAYSEIGQLMGRDYHFVGICVNPVACNQGEIIGSIELPISELVEKCMTILKEKLLVHRKNEKKFWQISIQPYLHIITK